MSDMSDWNHGEEIQNKVGHALSQAINEADGGMVIKWVCVAEILDARGERTLGTFVSDDAKRWDIFGLLKELEEFQKAHMIAEILEAHGHES